MTVLLILTGLGIYALACWLRPFGPCRYCRGAGTRHTLMGRLRPCPLCHGSGIRLRLGRRAANYARRIHRQATTARDTTASRNNH